MKEYYLMMLLVCAVAGQTCIDVPTDTTFPCEFQLVAGRCEAPYDELKNKAGQLVYCLRTCGLCDQGDLNALKFARAVDLIDECQKGNNPSACVEGRSMGSDSLAEEIESKMTEAIANLTEVDSDQNLNVPVIKVAIATVEAVVTAIATAMSEVTLRGVTSDPNSFATGIAESSALAIATATAEAFSIAIAEAGSEFTELQATTLITDTQRALTSIRIYP
eukprot:TRINITY_DN3224_c0_g1_i11.p1 TRINITY_DN3224_c0_g1~~TRINITY_DN3224_c0_g1_i11.p1  ORF type:complete len:220 (+),score=32.06 TRINITY_DN3224_c0_g1_i11:88-747(+)